MKILRATLGLLVSAGIAMSALPTQAQAAATPVGYPTAAATGFHHLGLVYDNTSRTVDDLTTWVAQYQNGVPVQGRWMFDSFLTLDLTAPSGTGTDLGATTAADWTALLNRWFGTTAGGGTIGAIDAAVTKVAATKSTSGALMGQPPTRRKIVVSIPWAADTQANFGMVNGQAADLRVASQRDRVTAWYMDQVKQRFAAAGYKNLDLWGVYLMREDILPGDEAWATHTATGAHQRGLKLAWIPYYKAPGWQNWRSFGIDVAIMQPSYGFRSPADGGAVDANRLVETADQARAYGLGVEIEARGSAGSTYEAAMFQQYLSEGARLGYRNAATAYFLGWNRAPVVGSTAYTALADYINGSTVKSGDTTPTWTWTGTTTRWATTTFASRDDLTAVRAEFASTGSTWRGVVTAYVLVDGAWKAGGTAYAGTPAAEGARQTVLVPLAQQSRATGVGVTFAPYPGVAAASVDRMVLDAVWPTGTSSLTTGAPYTVSTGAAPLGQYSDTAGTLNAFGRGLLTDGQYSSTGWWNARPVGWYGDNGPARVLFDLGSVRSVDKVVLYTHDSPDSAVNWPYNPAMVLSTTCPVLTTALRGTVESCGATTLPGSAPAVTSYNGPIGRQLDGTITFTGGTAVNARYATLVVQPTGWFLADEVRFFSGGVDVTSSVSYRILTPTNRPSVDTSSYGDNGVRLTDGNVAPMMSGPAVTGWKASGQSTVTVDLTRTTTVRSVTSWFVDAASWGVVKPPSAAVATSIDGVTWTTLGTATAASRTWYASAGYTVTGTAAQQARYVRVTVAANPASPNAWHMISEVEASAA